MALGSRGRAAGAALGAALLAAGCVNINVAGFGSAELRERVVYGEEGPKILLVEIEGRLRESGEEGAFGLDYRESAVARVRSVLDRAREDDEIRALLLRVNSPGGSVTASEIVYREIRRFKEETGVPVVAQLMGTAASGGYYATMAADELRAHPTSVTGSIGVLYAGVSFAGLMEKLGIENETLTTGEFKDAGSPLRSMRPAEREQLRSVLRDLHARFVEVVAQGRPALERAELEALADGRIFSAPQALERGLIDAVGDLPDAVDAAEERAGIERSRVVVYRRRRVGSDGNLFTSAARAPDASGAALERVLGPLPEPGFLYLWRPGAP